MKPERVSAPSALTAAAEDYLKAIWSATEWGGDGISTKGLADRFGTSAAAVSDAIRRLVQQGYVVHEKYGPIALSPLGEVEALRMVRRHRLLETFLVEMLGYSWSEVHDEAERLEHAVSDLMLSRIDDALGHPRYDPHGDPIPSADGVPHLTSGALNLGQAPDGVYRVVRVSDDDAVRLSEFESRMIVPGSVLHAAGNDVTVNGSATIRLAEHERNAIWVIAVPRS